jgi:hypothetical protein
MATIEAGTRIFTRINTYNVGDVYTWIVSH